MEVKICLPKNLSEIYNFLKYIFQHQQQEQQPIKISKIIKYFVNIDNFRLNLKETSLNFLIFLN